MDNNFSRGYIPEISIVFLVDIYKTERVSSLKNVVSVLDGRGSTLEQDAENRLFKSSTESVILPEPENNPSTNAKSMNFSESLNKKLVTQDQEATTPESINDGTDSIDPDNITYMLSYSGNYRTSGLLRLNTDPDNKNESDGLPKLFRSINDLNYNKDLGFFFRVLYGSAPVNDYEGDGDSINDKLDTQLKNAMRLMKVFNNAMLSYGEVANRGIYNTTPPSLQTHIFGELKRARYEEAAKKLNTLIGVDFKFGIETKRFFPRRDLGYTRLDEARSNSVTKDNYTHSVVMKFTPEGEPEQTITLLTLASGDPLTKRKVINGRKTKLGLMYDQLEDTFRKQLTDQKGDPKIFTSFFEMKKNTSKYWYNVLTPSTNMQVVKVSESRGILGSTIQSRTLDQFRKDNPQWWVSKPYVVSTPKGKGDNVGDLIGKYTTGKLNGTNGANQSFIGRPVVFVSSVPLDGANVVRLFNDQLAQSLTDPNYVETIRAIPLDTAGVSFKEWVTKNKELSKGLKNAVTKEAFNMDNKAYGNAFKAAELLKNIYNVHATLKSYTDTNRFDDLRKEFPQLRKDTFTDSDLKSLQVNLNSFLSRVMYIIGVQGGDIKFDKSAKETLAKKFNLSSTDEAKLKEADTFNKLYETLMKVSSTKANSGDVLLNCLNEIVSGDVNDAAELTDFKFDSTYATLIAIRAAAEGGRLSGNAGVFPPLSDPNLDPNREIINKFYDGVDALLNKVMPKGILLNPGMKTTGQGETDTVFNAFPATNAENEFSILVDLVEPKFKVNPEDYNITGQDALGFDQDAEKNALIEANRVWAEGFKADFLKNIPEEHLELVSSIVDTELSSYNNDQSRSDFIIRDINAALNKKEFITKSFDVVKYQNGEQTLVTDVKALIQNKLQELKDSLPITNVTYELVNPDTISGDSFNINVKYNGIKILSTLVKSGRLVEQRTKFSTNSNTVLTILQNQQASSQNPFEMTIDLNDEVGTKLADVDPSNNYTYDIINLHDSRKLATFTIDSNGIVSNYQENKLDGDEIKDDVFSKLRENINNLETGSPLLSLLHQLETNMLVDDVMDKRLLSKIRMNLTIQSKLNNEVAKNILESNLLNDVENYFNCK